MIWSLSSKTGREALNCEVLGLQCCLYSRSMKLPWHGHDTKKHKRWSETLKHSSMIGLCAIHAGNSMSCGVACLVVDVLDPGLPCPHIPALRPQLAHASQRQLPQVALLDAAGHQRHGDVALDAVYANLQGRP